MKIIIESYVSKTMVEYIRYSQPFVSTIFTSTDPANHELKILKLQF